MKIGIANYTLKEMHTVNPFKTGSCPLQGNQNFGFLFNLPMFKYNSSIMYLIKYDRTLWS